MPFSRNPDFVWADGPATSPVEPYKPDIRIIMKEIEQIIDLFVSSGGLIYSSLAALSADLSRNANSMAWVLGDPVAANNGVYGKIGGAGSGSWTRRGDLPYSFIVASNTGAGTANAILASSFLPVSGSSLVFVNVAATNTSSPVTISFNGGTVLTIKTNGGNDIVAGGLTSGMVLLGVVSGSTFRVLNDQVSSAIISAAEGWANIAQAAANGNLVFITKTAAAAANISASIHSVSVKGATSETDGKGGLFVDTNNGSTETFTSADGRTWYRSKDVSLARMANDAAAAIVTPFFRKSFKKRVRLQSPIRPSSYAAAVTANGTAYVYPQGFTVDEATNLRYTVFSGASGVGKNLIEVTNWSTGAYVRGFMAGTGYTNPVIDNDPTTGKKCIVLNGATAGTMEYYDISTLPTEMSSPSPIWTPVQRDYLYKSLRKGNWLFCKFDTPRGTYRRVYRHYRALRSGTTFTAGQEVAFNITDVGDNNTYQSFMPHMQALDQGDGYLAAAFGGSFNTGGSPTPSQYWGVKIFPPTGGRPWVEALVKPDFTLQKFNDSGYPATRVENEGIWVSSDNKVYTLNILRSATATVGDETTRGVIILEEFAEGDDVIDFSAGATTSVLVDTSSADLMKGASNVTTNPLTGTTIASIDDVFDFMAGLEIEVKSFWSSNHVITAPGGGSFTSSSLVVARAGNNGTTILEEIGANTYRKWLVQNGTAPRTYTISIVTFGGTAVQAADTHEMIVGADGGSQIFSRRPGTAGSTHYIFQNNNGTVGTIQTSGTATSYNVSSDETWKEFIGDYDAERAIEIIRADPVREFNWDEAHGGGYAVGWGAQTSYLISNDLASPGGWFDPITDEEWVEGGKRWVSPIGNMEANESDMFYVLEGEIVGRNGLLFNIGGESEDFDLDTGLPFGVLEIPPVLVEARYRPWGLDQAKRTPYLWAAMSGVLDILDELRAEVASLKKDRS